MRVKHASVNRLYWSLGRAEGDKVFGVELHRSGSLIKRTVIARGKYGREEVIFEEVYSEEEFAEILSAANELLTPKGLGCSPEAKRRAILGMISTLRGWLDEF
uniref:Uncharacterized protein n=1 Tax=Candidatus Methanomethylicus mesodigestus TaxID=1867258 RepID=A0A7C3N8Y1_9CREN